ncbi:hypothetical protein P740_007900 [Helicobacter pylori E48]|uniref:hypothetical protein n=1 Tax=Helicobacter pylori TaxID=210 RepID=UPI0004A3CA45|nr:hypothetical protein [Helicobacter pylori]NOK31559.1 hypothetical protein [Helicobacter pylori E48]
MKIISFENNSSRDGHLLIPCRIYCVELEIAHNDLGLNAIEKCALKLKELGVKDEKELKEFLGLGELDLLKPILEKIETKTLPEYKKIHAHFYYNLINQEFLHFVDLERVRTIDGKKLENNEVEFFADSRFKAESLNPKENNKSFVNDIIIYKTIKTSITYHKQDTLRHAKVMNWHVLKGDYYLHAKAFNDSKEIRVECKNHPIKKMAEKLKETKWFEEKWNKKQYTQTGESKPSKRIRVFKNFTAFDDRLDRVEYNLKNLHNNQKKLEICGALYDIYEQIFDGIPSLKGREIYKAKDLSEKSMRLGFEQISKDLNDSRLNALLRYEEKVMQALAKSYPSFLQDLHDLKKYRNKDKHGEKSQYGFFLTRVELERYRDEIYFLVENLLKNPLIKEKENAQKEKHEEKHYKKNAEIDAQRQLSNLNAPKPLFECFVGVNLAKAYYSKSEKEEKEREKEEMILNFCKIFEITLFKAIQKQPKLDFKTKDELLRDYPNLGNSLREVREDFLKRAFEYNKTSLGAYVLVLLSCKYFESVFEEVQEVQEWLDFIARLIALRGHARKITQKLKELKEENLEKLEKQVLEYFKKIANKIYPKEKR